MNITYKMSATITVRDLFRLLGIPCGPRDARIRRREITITPILTEPTRANNQYLDHLGTEVLQIELKAFRPTHLPKRARHA